MCTLPRHSGTGEVYGVRMPVQPPKEMPLKWLKTKSSDKMMMLKTNHPKEGASGS
jgi:hypothetical protein